MKVRFASCGDLKMFRMLLGSAVIFVNIGQKVRGGRWGMSHSEPFPTSLHMGGGRRGGVVEVGCAKKVGRGEKGVVNLRVR